MKKYIGFILFLLVSKTNHGQSIRLVMPEGHSESPSQMTFSQDGKLLFTSSTDNKLFIWETRTGKLLKSVKHDAYQIIDNSKYLAITTIDTIPCLKIYSKTLFEPVTSVKLFNLPDNSLLSTNISFSSSEETVILNQLGTSHQLIIDIVTGGVIKNEFDKNNFDYLSQISFNVSDTVFSKSNPLMAISKGDGSIIIKSIKKQTENVLIQKKSAMPVSMSFSKNDMLFAVGTDKGSSFIFDIENAKLKKVLKDGINEIIAIQISFDSKKIVTADKTGIIVIWDLVTGKVIGKIVTKKKIESIRFDHTGRYLLGVTSQIDRTMHQFSSEAYLWSWSSGELVKKIENYNEGIDFSLVIDNEQTNLSYKVVSGFIKYDSSHHHYYYQLEDDSLSLHFKSRYLNYAGTHLNTPFVLNGINNLNQEEMVQVCSIIKTVFGPQVKWLIEQQETYAIEYNLKKSNLEAGVISNTSQFLFQNDNTGLKLFDFNEHKLLVSLYFFYSNDHLLQIPSGYYLSSTGTSALLYYVKGLQIISFDQLDVKYNRPDKVLEAIGNTDTALIKSYRKAWEKRIKKLGIDTTSFRDGYSVPEADFTNRDAIEYEQKTGVLKLLIKGNDNTYKLDRFNVWVNETPIFGQRGINIRNRDKNDFDTTITIKLSQGENRIETSIINVNGTESYRMPLTVNYTPAVKQKESVRFIGIGIDQFADYKYNLQYSAKDIRDLSKKLKEKYGNDIIIDTLFNEDVTTNNVKALKQKLLQTTENDKVIVAYSGHGMLSKEYDYFLSTYSVNFEKPEQNGLPYDELENLLDSIPARKKLMLIDACHSGEVDKEDLVTLNATPDSLIKGLKPVAYKKEGQLGLKNSFELMQSLFVNVGKSTGATIISAAAGTQFALERNDLKNGVFTYSILEAIKTNTTMKISELKSIVGKRVEELTNGLQKPTSRNETIAVDWNVW